MTNKLDEPSTSRQLIDNNEKVIAEDKKRKCIESENDNGVVTKKSRKPNYWVKKTTSCEYLQIKDLKPGKLYEKVQIIRKKLIKIYTAFGNQYFCGFR